VLVGKMDIINGGKMVMLEDNCKTYLITGGEGFIGRKLVDKLLSQGHKVIIIDNNITSYEREALDNVEVIHECVSKAKITDHLDGIYHLASVAAPRLFNKQIFNVILPNVTGTMNMLEHAKENECRLLYASSSEVYGDSGILTQQKMTEYGFGYHRLLSEKSVYSTSKSMGEELLRQAKNQIVDCCSMRIFNVYGPNMDTTLNGNGRVFPNFYNAIKNSKPINIEGDGNQKRSFMYIDDCVDALSLLMNSRNKLPDVVNIGSEELYSVNDLAKLIASKLDLNFEVNYAERMTGDPEWRLADCTLISQVIGWRASTSLPDGISKIVDGD
jgi:nucleoside-diphosphate-sugar epimerase